MTNPLPLSLQQIDLAAQPIGDHLLVDGHRPGRGQLLAKMLVLLMADIRRQQQLVIFLVDRLQRARRGTLASIAQSLLHAELLKPSGAIRTSVNS